jgi:predicted acyl esterase
MRFLDLHLRGLDSEIDDPVISVQDNFGRYRAEPSWPPPDADSFVTELRTGTYVDADTGQQDDIWSSSAPLDHDVWLAGEPTITVDVATTAPRANFTAQLFDVHPDGQAIEVSRDAHLVRGVGTTTLEFPLMGQDWVFEAGHRIAVLLARENNSWFVHIPSGAVVTVENATITLPLLTTDRTVFLGGQVTNRLSGELQRWDFAPIGPWSTVPFDLPPAIDTGAR